MDIKISLFAPAQMWIMKDGGSKDFYDLDALCFFLDCLAEHDTELTSTDSGTASHTFSVMLVVATNSGSWCPDSGHKRGRDMVRPARLQGNRDMALKAVGTIMNDQSQDKFHSPLKPPNPEG
ncbi:hypothetical protein NDU88_008021 [Pleurodeles waltl]|uniref:Uncharacterized protein n=1 Tax=Pleurodeles waltl TaxID=8319 RepID=A0AAV7VW17_PLEWA|nr:hypothetical protein NDU88_008021 [Pleurodeles waltl]